MLAASGVRTSVLVFPVCGRYPKPQENLWLGGVWINAKAEEASSAMLLLGPALLASVAFVAVGVVGSRVWTVPMVPMSMIAPPRVVLAAMMVVLVVLVVLVLRGVARTLWGFVRTRVQCHPWGTTIFWQSYSLSSAYHLQVLCHARPRSSPLLTRCRAGAVGAGGAGQDAPQVAGLHLVLGGPGSLWLLWL